MRGALASFRAWGRPLRTRVLCAAVAGLGGFVPLAAATQWPAEIILFVLLTVGLGVPLSLYVLLVRTQVMSTVTGCVLAAAGVLAPLPGYPDFVHGVAGRWGFVLLLLPVVLLAVWLVGWLIDLVVRADRRLGDEVRPPVPGSGVALRPSTWPVRSGPGPGTPPAAAPGRVVARGVATVGPPRPPGITVQYLTPPPAPEAGPANQADVIQADVIQADVIQGDVIQGDIIRGGLIEGDVVEGHVIRNADRPQD